MKKIVLLILTLLLLTAVVNANPIEERLAAFNIMNGYDNGDFGGDDFLTRAQFAKITVSLLNANENAVLSGMALPFPDVASWHWAAPYIEYTSKNKLITGYPDGAFKPEENINFAQIVTILLKTMDFKELTGVWPYNYINKAKTLGLLEGFELEPTSYVTRSQIAVLIDRALFTEIEEKRLLQTAGFTYHEDVLIIASNREDKSLALNEIKTSIGIYKTICDGVETGRMADIVVNKDNEIVDVQLIPQEIRKIIVEEIKNDEIIFSGERFEFEDTFVIYADNEKTNYRTSKNLVSMGSEITFYSRGDSFEYCFIKAPKVIEPIVMETDDFPFQDAAILFRNGYRAEKDEFRKYDILYYNEAAGIVTGYDIKISGTYSEALPSKSNIQTVVIDGKQYEIQTTLAKSKLDNSINSFETEDYITLLLGSDNKVVDVITMEPAVAEFDFDESVEFIGDIRIKDKSGLKVYRNGYLSTLSDIKKYDVLYYTTSTNTIEVFSDKITGLYEEAYPNKARVNEIKIADKTYKINLPAAKAKLGETPDSFKIFDQITLLLGKDKEVVDVVNITDKTALSFGVIINTYTNISSEDETKGQLEYISKVFKTDGNIYEYKSLKDYESYKGKLVELNFEGGLLTLSNTKYTNTIQGDFDKQGYFIGEHQLLKDVKILQLVSNFKDEDAKVEIIDYNKITQRRFEYEDIIHAEGFNKFGDIGLLYMNNFQKSGYIYGVLVERERVNNNSTTSGIYKIMVDGHERQYSDRVYYSINTGTPIMMNLTEAGEIKEFKPLTTILTSGQLQEADGNRILVNGKSYTVATDVQIYKFSRFEYESMAINEISKNSKVSLYADTNIGNGGIIRIIVIRD